MIFWLRKALIESKSELFLIPVNKQQAIGILKIEGWTEADAKRAFEGIDFGLDPDELFIRRVSSQFAGAELLQRQRLQAAQKAQVTRKTKELERRALEIQSLASENLALKTQSSPTQDQELIKMNQELIETNLQLKKDNKDLKNIVDVIRLKFAQNTKSILKLEGSELKRAVVKLFNSTLG